MASQFLGPSAFHKLSQARNFALEETLLLDKLGIDLL